MVAKYLRASDKWSKSGLRGSSVAHLRRQTEKPS
jgi:hypothetical protein